MPNAHPSSFNLKVEPQLESVRSDPRFHVLAARMGLSTECRETLQQSAASTTLLRPDDLVDPLANAVARAQLLVIHRAQRVPVPGDFPGAQRHLADQPLAAVDSAAVRVGVTPM